MKDPNRFPQTPSLTSCRVSSWAPKRVSSETDLVEAQCSFPLESSLATEPNFSSQVLVQEEQAAPASM